MALLLRAKHWAGDNFWQRCCSAFSSEVGIFFSFYAKVMRHCKKFRDVHFDPDAFPPLTHSFESELFEPDRITVIKLVSRFP